MYDAECATSQDDASVSFSRVSPDGEQGFPGNLKVNLTYILTEDNELILNYKGTTDKTTIANFTNHSYYNLNGHDSGEVYEQKLMIMVIILLHLPQTILFLQVKLEA